MALITFSECTVLRKKEGEYNKILILTPATADSNDTLDVSTLVTDGDICGVVGWDVTIGDSVTATYAVATGLITIDAAGGTTDVMYAIEITFVSYVI